MTIDSISSIHLDNKRVARPVPVHLPALDGIRGLAALYVVLGHAMLSYQLETSDNVLPGYGLDKVLAHGKWAVSMFIVLSGFCLMAPVVRSGGVLTGGALQYLKRRARRILPPYYAALGLSLLGIWLIPALSKPGGNFWNLALPAFRTDVILSHVLMVFNLNNNWIFKINPPFWSVATEWQIYFLFPFVFLPVVRKWGYAALLLVAFAIGLIPHFLLQRTGWSVSDAHPWFTGLFAFGMLAAVACFQPETRIVAHWLRKYPQWIALTGCLMVCALELFTDWRGKKQLPYDLAYGIASAGFLVFLTRGCTGSGPDHVVARTLRTLLGWKPIKALGDMSYSLYLIHTPVLIVVHRWTTPWHTSALRVLSIMFGIGVPMSILVASVFHVCFERPFMRQRGKSRSLVRFEKPQLSVGVG